MAQGNGLVRQLAGLQAAAAAGQPAWLQRLRGDAWRRFEERGLPTTRDEDWRYTSLAALERLELRPPAAPADAPRRADLDRFLLFEPAETRLVFVDGRYAPELSAIPALPGGARLMSLRAAVGERSELLREPLGRPGAEAGALAAHNGALWSDGAFLHLPRGAALEQPVHLLFLATPQAQPAVHHPRNLFLCERSSRATVVETYASLDGGRYWTNALSTLAAGPDSALEHYKVQEEAADAFHTALLHAELDRNSRLVSHAVTLGAALSRSEVAVRFGAEGGECTLYGLYWISGGQHADHATAVDHAAPRCTSHQVYRGVLDGHARGIFNGLIRVRPGAQQSDAHQSNKNLLLSERALADSKPQLEILANDVKCTHGVAIGRLDRDALFYLRSRGLGEKQARAILTRAFASAVTEHMRIPALRCRLDRMLALGLPDERELVTA